MSVVLRLCSESSKTREAFPGNAGLNLRLNCIITSPSSPSGVQTACSQDLSFTSLLCIGVSLEQLWSHVSYQLAPFLNQTEQNTRIKQATTLLKVKV